MNEHEKRLGALLVEMKAAYPQRAQKALEAYDAVLREHKVALSAARDAALEEALAIVRANLEWQAPSPTGDAIRALTSRPAERYLSEAQVRGALSTAAPHAPGYSADEENAWADGWRCALTTAREALGVDLDAAPASSTCRACGHVFHDDNACAACRPGECIRSDS
jgi:hypothetical protein